MSVEEKIKREVLLKELTKDPWLAHCFIKVEDAERLYCRTALGISCDDVRPDCRWGHLPAEYRPPVARFVIEGLWAKMPEEDREEWLELVEQWTSPIYKELSVGAAAVALIESESPKEMARALGLSYGIVYKSIRPKLGPFENLAKLAPIFDTRSPHQKTLAHLSEPRRITERLLLACTGFVAHSNDDGDARRKAFYKWRGPERYPEFDEARLAERVKSQMDFIAKHHTIEGWHSAVPSSDE